MVRFVLLCLHIDVVCNNTTFVARLTTFVMRSFGLARSFIFIDPNVLQSEKDWLTSNQGSDGCFMQQGTLYHSDMKVCVMLL